MVGRKGLSGRPKGRKTLRSDKTQSNVRMTPEAWAILHKKSQDLGVFKSDYLENLVRRGDLDTYDMTITFLHEMIQDFQKDLRDLEMVKTELEEKIDDMREFMRKIGVNPNLIP